MQACHGEHQTALSKILLRDDDPEDYCTHLGDDEEGTPIFEDEEGAIDVGDAGASAPAAAPALSATSSEDEGGPLPMASSSLPRLQAQADGGPAKDAGEVTSEIVPSRQLMDVKSAFLNGYIEEEVYVRQSPGFESVKFPDRVYKLRKALYGLKQAPRACFAEQMSGKFEMSLMGELQFLLGLQINQSPEGTFVHQAKYTKDILKKFDMGDSKPITTPMSTNTALDADEDGEAVDQKEFRGMIGSLLYLTVTRPDIQFAVCLYARYQASPRTSHRQVVKRIFRLQVEGVDNALVKGKIESQWTGFIALLV
ncbi:hypothetical protein U9M48_030571 [Paspalum notatum var. saurae]|uniref:Reverse transcriptase Ty1/copia-type domain-containing protein n=1 Tax=Paspalum notatum var. saurae TaxID=547442 RepID=A0AAQ3U186_PASNO